MSEWVEEVRDGMKIEWDVPIPMEDGIVLRADVFRPITNGTYPVLISYGPYGKGLAFQEGYAIQWQYMVEHHPDVIEDSTNKYQNWEVVDPEKWVPDGYVIVRVDSRGMGRSPGNVKIYSARETKDFYQCIEWAAVQPWSNGKVGLAGISYYAMNQYEVAALQPPHLVAMCPWEGSSDWYREFARHGGILCEFAKDWYRRQLDLVQHGVGQRGYKSPVTGELVAGPDTLPEDILKDRKEDLVGKIAEKELIDDWYLEHSGNLKKITVPILSSGNWGGQGLHLRGNVEAFTQSSSKEKYLEMHGGAHWALFYTKYGTDLQKRFFNYYLKGEKGQWESQARIQLQIRHADGSFTQRNESEWPIARTQWTKYYLDAVGNKLTKQPPKEKNIVEYDPFSTGVTFRTDPLPYKTEITGPMAAKLFISSETKDADLFLVLRAFDQDEKEITFMGALDPNTPLSLGWLRASHRKLDMGKSLPYRPFHSHDEIQPLTPKTIYEVDVEIWPTCVVLPPGFRLALSIRGCDYHYDGELTPFARNFHYAGGGVGPFTHKDEKDRPREIFGGRVSLYLDPDHCSYLLLPIIPE